MVSLYIENRYIELDKEVQFAITKTFEDISNPTSIINDWSKTVSIPFTDKNNETFGHIYNPDRLTIHDETLSTGLYFNPLKKLDFRLEWDSAVLMTGYAKMTSVTKTNGTGRYNVTLNGELGKVFQEMKKITFDTSTEDTKYLIDGREYLDETITKDLVYDLWTKEGGNDTALYLRRDINFKLEEMLGFAPNNAFESDFDYKTYQKNVESSNTFAETLDKKVVNEYGEGNNYETITGVDSGTVIGDGLLPREIGEFRSYLQLPYIFFNKLFQIFTEKTKSITGYNVVLDDNWFNQYNPYWSKLVYMLKKIDYSKDATEPQTEFLNSTSSKYTLNSDYKAYTPILHTHFTNKLIEGELSDNIQYLNLSFPLNIRVTNPRNYNGKEVGVKGDKIIFHIALYVLLNVKDSNGNIVHTKKLVYINPDMPDNVYNGWEVVKALTPMTLTESRIANLNVGVDFSYTLDKSVIGDNYSVDITTWFDDLILYAFYLNERDAMLNNRITTDTIELSTNRNTYSSNLSEQYTRSFSKFTLNDLWNNDYNLFTEILNYCKQYRIGIFCDNLRKTITFKHLSTYFSDYTVEDWTNKLDISKNYTIQPITFDNKYVLFNYKPVETELNNTYNEKYGVNYGEYKLTTDYEFNNDTTELFKDIKGGMIFTENQLSWTTLYEQLSIVYTLGNEYFLNNKDDSKKAVDMFGSTFFYKGLLPFDNSGELRNVSISDDTLFQQLNKTFIYTQQGAPERIVRCDTYPYLDIVWSNNLCLFNIPMENYTVNKEGYDNTKSIYTNFWKQYLDERYNTNNKIVTCYLDISPTDYMNFEFNKFIKIENQLYMVNKIYDYDITSNSSTKVDLITIQDIEGYTSNTLELPLLKITDANGNNVSNVTLNYEEPTKTFYISSYSDITWTCNNGNATVNGVNAKSGVIKAGINKPITFTLNRGTTSNYTVGFVNETGDRKYMYLTDESGFRIFKQNGEEWNPSNDRFVFEVVNGEIPYEINYLNAYSTEPILVTDVYNNLHGVSINQILNGGYISAGMPTILDIWNDREFESVQGTYRLTSLGVSIDIDIEVIKIE